MLRFSLQCHPPVLFPLRVAPTPRFFGLADRNQLPRWVASIPLRGATGERRRCGGWGLCRMTALVPAGAGLQGPSRRSGHRARAPERAFCFAPWGHRSESKFPADLALSWNLLWMNKALNIKCDLGVNCKANITIFIFQWGGYACVFTWNHSLLLEEHKGAC